MTLSKTSCKNDSNESQLKNPALLYKQKYVEQISLKLVSCGLDWRLIQLVVIHT